MNYTSKFIKSVINFYILFTINISLIIIIICENNNTNPAQITNDFFELNLLQSGSKLELADNIICFYDYNFSESFNKEKILICLEEYQNIYILNNKDTYLYKYNIGNLELNKQGNYFSLIPYSFENNIYFIITFIYDNNHFNISQYQITNDTCTKINSIEKELELISNNDNLYNCTVSLNSHKYLICFFMENEWINSLIYDINQKILYNINKTKISYENFSEKNSSITSSSIAINQNKNEILLCFCYNKAKSQCYFYDINKESFNKNYAINCKEYITTSYFIETNEYTVICREEGKKIYLYRLDENSMELNLNITDADKYKCISVKHFFLYYDSNKKKYNLINDCFNNHTYIYLLNISTEINLITNSSDKATTNLIEYNIININEKKTIEEILSNLTGFFEDKKIGENYEVKTQENIIYIRPTNSTGIIPSKTHLNLSQCESVLREEYNLNSSILTLFLLEIANTNNESLVNKVEYKIYNENFTELNLNKCKDLNLEVIYGIKKDIKVEYDKIIFYQNLGINIFNLSDKFFNDICQIFPDFDNDIILEDRIKDIFLNYSVCEEGCTYKEFDSNYYTFKCECSIKDSININITNITLEKSNTKTNNFEVLKCLNLVFSPDDKINNIGFWIFTFVLGGHVPILFHFINSGLKPIQEFITNEMSEFGYIKGQSPVKGNKKLSAKIKGIRGKKGKKGKKDKKGKRKKNLKNNKNEENKNENEKEENKQNQENINDEKNEKEIKEEKENKENKEKENTNEKEENENEGKKEEKKDKEVKEKEENEKKDNKNEDRNNEESKENEEKEGNNETNKNNISSPPLKKSKKKIAINNKANKKIKKNGKGHILRFKNKNNNKEKLNSDNNKKKNKKRIKNNSVDNNKTKILSGRSKKFKNSKKSKKKNLVLDLKSDNSSYLMKNSNKSLSPNFIQTADFEFEFDYKDEENDINDKAGINLIKINLNETKKKVIPEDSFKILNNYTFEEAVEYDRRPLIKIFYIFLLSKQVIFHTFLYKSPLELLSIKILVLIFIISSDLAFNAFFYFNSFISKKYSYTKGLFFFTFTNNIVIIFISIVVVLIIRILITKLGNSTIKIREIFSKEEEKLKNDKLYKVSEERKEEINKEIEEILNKLKIKIIILFTIEFIVMLFYWYFATAFCHVYTNTQFSWILNTFLTIVFSFFIEGLFCLIYAELYRISVDGKLEGLYKFVMFIYNYV